MKKIIITLLLLSFSHAFAENKQFVVEKMTNSCSSWGHSLTFRFKDNSLDKKTINITIAEFKQNIEERKFYFSDFSTTGSMSLCQLKHDNVICENQEGYLLLNKSYKQFKTGDYVEGEVFIKQSPPIKFNFQYTIPDISNTKPLVCRRY